jgi:Sulfotransferase family
VSTSSQSKTDPLSKLVRVAKRAGSARAFAGVLAEETFVRAWSHEPVRAAIRPFIPVRHAGSWVFLVGCYNSGTTLLQHLLGSHPEIAGLPREGVRFTKVLSDLEANGHHMMWDDDYRSLREPTIEPAKAYERIVADWSIFWKRGARVFLDKSVSNTARIDWLRKTFPNARFIGIYRNGYCIAEGLHRRALPPAWYQDKTGSTRYPLEATGRQWVWANQDMIQSFKFDPNSMLVRFEDLIARPPEILADIFAFIGVEPGEIRYENRVLQVAGKNFDIRDPNPASLARLTDVDMAALDPVIGPMMRQLGYDGQGQ